MKSGCRIGKCDGKKKNKKYLLKEPVYYIEIVNRFISLQTTQIYFKGSPDINDDYLIDIVQQTSAVGLVTGDKPLLKWKNPPVQIIS